MLYEKREYIPPALIRIRSRRSLPEQLDIQTAQRFMVRVVCGKVLGTTLMDFELFLYRETVFLEQKRLIFA